MMRILQLITTFKIDHNFACEIIYVLLFATTFVRLRFYALARANCFVCILRPQFTLVPYVLSVRANEETV